MTDKPRTFEHFPAEQTCIICRTNKDAECWLMAIDGTGDGTICEAVPVHVECTGRMTGRMRYSREQNVVYFFVEGGYDKA